MVYFDSALLHNTLLENYQPMSPFFKSAQVYSLRRNDVIDTKEIENQLASQAFKPCASQDKESVGWTPIIGELFALVQGNNLLIKWQREEKILPSTVVKEEVAKRAAVREEQQERRLKKTERDALKDEVIHAFMPRAFTRQKFAFVWIDLDNSRVVVNASSAKQAENILALLRKSIGSLPVVPFTLESPMSLTAKEWLASQELPAQFHTGDSVRLSGVVEGTGSVAYTKSEIFSDEVVTNINNGKIVAAIGLNWNERISFKIDDGLSITGIKFADILTEQNNDISREDVAIRFDADFLLFRSEFNEMFSALVAALGGEVVYGA